MRVLLQRVTRASVRVADERVGVVGPGWCAFVGVRVGDTEAEARHLAKKVWELRALKDDTGAMNRSLADANLGAGQVLVVSQFTLYGATSKGRRPSWSLAARGAEAAPLVSLFADTLRAFGAHVECGVFGADMEVELVNDGPVTVLLEREASGATHPAGAGTPER